MEVIPARKIFTEKLSQEMEFRPCVKMVTIKRENTDKHKGVRIVPPVNREKPERFGKRLHFEYLEQRTRREKERLGSQGLKEAWKDQLKVAGLISMGENRSMETIVSYGKLTRSANKMSLSQKVNTGGEAVVNGETYVKSFKDWEREYLKK